MRSVQSITSRQNPRFKRWVSLLDSQGVKAHQQCVVAGTKLRKELRQHSEISLSEILLPPKYDADEDLACDSQRFVLSKSLYDELDIFGTKDPLMVCATPSLPPFDLTQAPAGLEVLCPIGDPGNLGALLRSCLAFGVHRVVLLCEAVHPFHPKVIRASSGAVFFQPLTLGCSISELHQPDRLQWIIPLDMQGEDIATLTWPQNIRLLIGEEGMGIPSLPFSRQFCISQIHPSIPLNATVASSIALHSYRQQHPQQCKQSPI